jgi:glycosyltransferase involved in cell wall biosynthesis
MKDRKKIAFVHCPHKPDYARLETMAFSLNSLLSLAKIGWNIDLYLWEKPNKSYKDLLPDTVTINYFRDLGYNPGSSIRWKEKLKAILTYFQFKWRKNYCCVFGLGQIGAYIASIMAMSNKCPFLYINDEFPSNWGKSNWLYLEQQFVKNATMVIIPDPHRFHYLSKEIDIAAKPYAILPNIPLLNSQFEPINWHEKLGIPIDSIPFLHAGYIGDWSQVPEILSSVPYWHKKAVLIMHSPNRELTEIYRKQVPHLEIPGRVFWSYESLSESHINSLAAYVAGNFALYRSGDPNTNCMGFASGKLMRSLACGSPVIASRQPSLSFVEDYHLGFLVNHPSDIPNAIEQIIQNREAYRRRCLDFCNQEVSFEKAWQKFCEHFRKITNIDLMFPN